MSTASTPDPALAGVQAGQTALAALASDPDNADALAQLVAIVDNGADAGLARAIAEARRAHRERGDFELCAALIDQEIALETAAGSDPERLAELYFDKGRLLADDLLRDPEAAVAFERVLELRPGDETAEDALGHIALVRDNWQKILRKYLDEAQHSTDRQLTASLYLSVAELHAKYQPGPSVEEHLRKALEVDPRSQKASLRLERLLRAGERWDELGQLFEQRAEAAPSREDRVLAYLSLGELERRKRGRANEAAEAYKKVLGIDPNNSRALAAVVEFYTETQDWQPLIRVYENALRARPRGEPELGTLLQIAMIWWKKLGNLEAADEYWKRIRKAEPGHPAMLEFYRAYHGADAGKLLPILQQAQRLSSDEQRSLDLALEAARAAEGSRGGVDRAIDLWKGVLRITPGHAEAQGALERLYERAEKWNALLELHKEALDQLGKQQGADEAAIVEAKIARLLQMVRIYRDRLAVEGMVINAYGQILQLRPDHAEALSALAQRYEARGSWNDLIGVLQRRADLTADRAEKATLLKRVADLWIEKFGNLHQAVRPLEELATLEPDNVEVLAKLRDLYTRRRAWRALLDLERKEEARLAAQGQAVARRAKLVEIAKLTAERLGDTREAIAAWNRVLELDVLDAEALNALGALYERERRWPALVEILRRQASQVSEAKPRVALLERAANLLSERLGQVEPAAEIYREVLQLQPGHARALRTLQALFAQAGQLDDLVALYARNEQWEELYEVLQQTAERLPPAEGARRIEMLSRAAQVAHGQLRNQEKAARVYERILALDTDRGEATQGAARALLSIYRGQEKWARLLATHEVLLGFAQGDDEQLAMIRQIRELCEDKLGSRGLAFSWAARAYVIRPQDEALERDLERLADAAETWDELAEIYEREAAPENGASPERRLARLRRLADIAQNRQHRPDDARRHFEQILTLAPGDAEALAALEQLFAEGRSYPQLLKVYRQREAAWRGDAKDPARIDLLFKIAWIEEEKLSELDAARATLGRIRGLDPTPATELRALRTLERLEISGGTERQAALAEILERQLALAEHDEARIELAGRLAALYGSGSGATARPLDALAHLERSLALDPDRRNTHAAIEALLDSSGLDESGQRRALALLVPAYEERLKAATGEEVSRTATRLLGLLERQLRAAREPEVRQGLLVRLENLSERVPDDAALRGRRYDWAAEQFEADPGSRERRHALIDLGQATDRLDDVAVRFGNAESRTEDMAQKRELALELGALFEGPLGMRHEAAEAFRRVLALDPTDQAAESALERIYKLGERYTELRALLIARKDRAADTQHRVDALLAICDLDEGVLDDREAAAASYRELLDLDPQSSRAFRALERLHIAAERFVELEALLAAREPFAPSPREAPEVRGTQESRAHLRYRRAELFRDKLGDLDRAIELYAEVVSEEPTHEGARRALEALLRRPEARLRVARILQEVYEAEQAWPKLALVLGAERESLEGADVVPLLVRLATLQEERLGARQLALSTWREALRIDPSDERIRNAVERLAVLLGRHADLAAAWDEAFLVADPSDHPLRAELLARSARLYERELRDSQRAITTWRRLFDLDPANAELGQPAADALQRLYEADENWRLLVEVLHRKVEWTGSPDEQRQLRFRIARIQEELLVDPKAATATYQSLLEADPGDRGALDGLEKLHAAKGEWTDLADVLRRRVDLENDPAARRELLSRIAQLTERELADPEGAVRAWAAVLDESPEDLTALDAFARLHEAAGRKVDLLDVLERRIRIEAARLPAVAPRGAPSREERSLAALRMRAAAIELELGRAEGALERFREVLERDPRHDGALAGIEPLLDDVHLRLRAAEILEPRYRDLGDAGRLLRIHELLAQASPDLHERLTRLRQVAKLRAEAGNEDGAFEALSTAARLAVGEPDLAELLDRVEATTSTANRARLVELYRELAPDVLDATVQERVLLSVAAESERLGDRVTAREYYRRVLDAAPDNVRALAAIEGIYAAGEEWAPLYEIYQRRAELAATGANIDEDERRRYLLLGAHLCVERLGRASDAIPAYEEALQLQPVDVETSRALEALYTAGARWHELAELIERRLGFADDLDEAVALRLQLARLYDRELSDPERAVESYRAALGGDPNNAEAIAALERYLEDPTQGPAVSEVLEPIYVGRQAWQKLVHVFEIRLEGAEDPRTRLGLRRRIARIYEEQLEDLEGAFVAFTRVYREDAADRATRDQLTRLAGVLGAWERLAAVYEEQLENAPDAPGSEDALRSLASLYHERLADVDRARGAYARLIERNRDDELAFINLEKLLERAGRWPELLDVYREAAAATLDLAVRQRLLHRAAGIAEQRLADLDVAIQLNREILDIDPADAVAAAGLDRLFRRAERWHDLAELIERRIADRAAEDVEGWAADKVQLAELRSSALADTSAAVDLYEEVIGRRPGDDRAVRALEKIIVEPEHTYRIAQILGPIYRQEGSWQKLVVIHEAELEFLDDPSERYERLVELAQLHEQRGNDRRAAYAALLRTWREQAALGDEPDAVEREAGLFAELSRLAEAENLFGDLCDELERAVTDSLDQTLRARVFRRVAQLAEQRLNDRGRAIRALEQVLAAEEADEAAWDDLERLLRAEGRARDLCAALERRVTVVSDPDLRKDLHQRAAVVYEEQLREADSAIGAWRLVLDVDPEDQTALSALARLYRARGDHQALGDILDRQISVAEDAAQRRALRAELGALSAGPLADRGRAADAWRAILAEDPRDKAALVELTRVELAAGHYAEALEATDAQLELTTEATERDTLRLDAAALLEQHLSDTAGAVDRYAAVLVDGQASGVGAARGALERLARDRDHRAAAAAVLEPAYERAGEWAPLIELGELVLDGESDPAERRSWLGKMAAAAERGLSDGKGAFALWQRALREDPSDPEARAALERLGEAEGIPGELARVYEELLAGSLEPELARALALRLGELYEQRVGDEERAIAAYSRALEAPDGDTDGERGALVALDRLLSRAGRPRDLAEVLQRRAEIADATAERVELLHRLGVLYAGELVDLDGALAAFRDALEIDPAHAGSRTGLEALLDSAPHREAALDVLEPIAERDGDAARQNALAERRLTTLGDAAEQGALLERIAERAESVLGDPRAAYGAMARALTLDPASERLVEEVERLAGVMNRPVEAAELFERLAGSPGGDLSADVARALNLRAGRIWEATQAYDRAESRFSGLLAVDGEDAEALEALERIYRVRGDAARLVDVLTRRAGIELDVEAKKGFYSEAAQLAESALRDLDGAVTLWRQRLAADDADADALAALGRLLEQRERWPELADLLAQAARVTSDAEGQVALLGRLAAISAERLADLPRAVTALRELLEIEPNALSALDSLVALEARRGDESALKEALERKLAALPEGAQRIPVFRHLAELAGKRGDTDDALGYLYEVLSLDPNDLAAGEAQRTLLERAERWNDLVDVLSTEAERLAKAGDTRGELAMLVRAADLWEDKLSSPESATDLLEKILARDPSNVRALLSLARIAESSGDAARSRELLASAEAAAKTPQDVAELAFRRGRVENEAGDQEAALGHYRRALAAQPGHPGALAALIEHARQADDHAGLAELLETRIAAGGDDGEVRAARNETTRLYIDKLGAPDRARPHLEALLAAAGGDSDPGNKEALRLRELLADLHFAAGRFDEAERLYRALAELAAQQRRRGKDVARLHGRLGEIARQRGDASAALTALSEAQRLDASHAPTLVALGGLHRDKGDWEAARKIYRSLLLQNLEADAGITKAGVYLALGEIHEKLNEAPKAVGMYERALEIDVANESARAALSRLRS